MSTVSGGPRFDSDVSAFLTAAGITNTTQKIAINRLVLDLKSYGIWSKMKAIYPMVGGTASSHKFNLKDPRDLDTAFRLSFTAGWVHSSTGALPNGSSDYANTFFTPNGNLQLNSGHLSTYLRNHTTKVSGDIGAQNAGPNSYCTIFTAWSDGKTYYSFNSVDEGIVYTTTNKFHIVSRTASNAIKLYRNNVITNGTTTSTVNNPQNIYIGAINIGGGSNYYSNRETAFASIGDGLTDTEASNLYTAVQTYQTTLGRQV